ncbi:hypothetical protein A5893_16525 [Pedobacter psychrophilus]|uniref:TonB C-terminal domain-containing protein n=1 Tax=Pedobacter psychrophilus TaxID=1826909 RepID=A0A179DBY9_9SPHI|nr:carboxypeptidase-like regulatory domain-containing protein [Pedobacter psychrophilus]OAQ37973.1 hypothetical protein A5893_16525 [Pedobacter psychrophilus]
MNKQDKDIELIRQYLNGELSPTEMNSLEARALDDPFLQDALDGFTEFDIKNSDLSDLESRLNERIKDKGKILSLSWGIKQWGIAASIIFCITIAGIYFNQIPDDKNFKLADLQKSKQIPQAEKIKLDSSDSIENKIYSSPLAESKNEEQIALLDDNLAPNQSKVINPEKDIYLEPQKISADSIKSRNLNEVAVVGYATQYKKDIVGSISSVKQENLMAARSSKINNAAPFNNIKGKVVDEKDGSSLPGVSIKDPISGLITQSDANGEFNISASKTSDLVASYIGYETKNIPINGNDSLKIALNQAQSSLSEVVVIGYGKLKKSQNIIAGPKNGWSNFRKYLDEQAKLPNNKHGKVTLTFVIQADGKLTDFKVLKSFNAVADEKAVNLVIDYPGGWNGSTDKIPQIAKVTVKF